MTNKWANDVGSATAYSLELIERVDLTDNITTVSIS